ncbi:MAG: AAA family ATPase [Deltaproteobacteria bacterium]|nr:AAA family ATPase [Deltaproteobacteria bacterium]
MKAQLAVAKTPSLGRLHSVRSSLRARFLERDHVIDLMLTAVLARVHVFVLGPPGTGKSALASAIVTSIEGTTGFTWLMSKFTTPEDVFGPLSLQALQQGRFERLTTKKLPEAHVALLDEIFKSNSAILNACLTLMNERQFMNGTATLECPLITLIGASNELPDGDDLEALFDRFALRLVVPYIADPDNVRRLLSEKTTIPAATMTLDELVACQDEANAVEVPDAFIDVIVNAVKPKLEEQGVRASDRRWQQIVRFLQAYAYLDGKDAVSIDHCDVLPDLLWRDPASRAAITATVAGASNPTAARAAEIVDAAKEKVLNLKTPERDPQKRAEWLSAASLVGDELDSMLKELQGLGTSRKVLDAAASITKLKKRIAEQVNAMYSTGA